VANPGVIQTRLVLERMEQVLKPTRRIELSDDDEAHREAAPSFQSGCILDVSKLLGAGVKIRSAEDALEDALAKWKPAPLRAPRILEVMPEPLSAGG
jgi:hypothetical protein